MPLRRRAAVWIACALIACCVGTGATGTQTPAGPTFDVASVKESPSVTLDGVVHQNPGRFTVENLPLRDVIQYAYRIREYQPIGSPGWISRTNFNINATFTNASASDDDVRVMVQRLLSERFGFRAHRETRELPIYVLAVARGDGKLGPNLVRSDVDCDRLAAERFVQPNTSPRPVCSMLVTSTFVRGSSRTMSQFARALENVLRTPIVERTGLAGHFNIDVRWAAPRPPSEPGDVTAEDVGALFTALREQLGLKLDSRKGPVEMLVIDHVEWPTEN